MVVFYFWGWSRVEGGAVPPNLSLPASFDTDPAEVSHCCDEGSIEAGRTIGKIGYSRLS